MLCIYKYIRFSEESFPLRRETSFRYKVCSRSGLILSMINQGWHPYAEICAQVPESPQVDDTSRLGLSVDSSSSLPGSIGAGGSQNHGPEISFETKMIPIQECAVGLRILLLDLFSWLIFFLVFRSRKSYLSQRNTRLINLHSLKWLSTLLLVVRSGFLLFI
jgi:hypothetical protein